MSNAATPEQWSERQWTWACLHIIFCKRENCEVCKRIAKEIEAEKGGA